MFDTYTRIVSHFISLYHDVCIFPNLHIIHNFLFHTYSLRNQIVARASKMDLINYSFRLNTMASYLHIWGDVDTI